MASKVRVLLADDHQVVRKGLRMLVDGQPDMECVGEASDGRQAVAGVRDTLPDVAVLDVSMPRLNGLEAAELIRAEFPAVRVLALTRHADDAFLLRLLKAGVAGYVLKQSSADVMLAGIRAVAEGGSFLDPAVMGTVMGTFARDLTRTGAPATVDVTEREREVLRLIAWGYSNKEIAGKLDISVKTVEAHKANAMRKLNMRGRVDIVQYALLQGWLRNS
jgi:two-component system response regulator NreC